jgi:hypothetical protein
MQDNACMRTAQKLTKIIKRNACATKFKKKVEIPVPYYQRAKNFVNQALMLANKIYETYIITKI